MKTLFLKKGMPVATAVLAIAGAFATTSMQNNSNDSAATIAAYTVNAKGECNISVECNDSGLFFCRIGISGPMAYGKNPLGQCTELLYRVEP